MTHLEYLADTYKFKSTAHFLRIEESEKGTTIILDRTIMYPQGGGQPADHGVIVSGTARFIVTDVRLSPEGVVSHFGHFESGSFADGEDVELEIDQKRRMLNARVHSAGHLIDVAVTRAGIPSILPTKGYHFSDGPYVEFEGMLEDPQSWMEAVQRESNFVIQEDVQIIAEDLSPEEAKKRDVWAPEGKSARFVYFQGYESDGCGCGGTHVSKTGEIGAINIRWIKSKKGKTKIGYEVV